MNETAMLLCTRFDPVIREFSVQDGVMHDVVQEDLRETIVFRESEGGDSGKGPRPPTRHKLITGPVSVLSWMGELTRLMRVGAIVGCAVFPLFGRDGSSANHSARADGAGGLRIPSAIPKLDDCRCRFCDRRWCADSSD
jgi:hypothetical protein